MAGIGFELKKLFKGKGALRSIKAYAYSALVAVGPFILCVIVIVSILLFMNFMNVTFKERELFIATIVYAFIFSQIITSGFKMIVTRFISDMLYSKKFEYILPSLYGVLSIVLVISGAVAIVFFWNSPISIEIKITSYLLFMELIIIFLVMVYLSTLKDFIKIVRSFIWGVLVTLGLAFVFIRFTDLEIVFSLLLAMDIGFFVIITLLVTHLKSFFKKSVKKYFYFLIYFDRYSSIFFISLFYTLALYSHNFLFWNSKLGVVVESTYVYAPIYDVPTFYAFLSVMASMVVFVVSVETSFYEKYRRYYSLITGRGNYSDIENARKDMTRVLWAEIRNIIEIQLFVSLVFIAIGYYVLPKLGLSQLSLDIFNLLTLGAFLNIILLIIIMILLYFEDRKGALFVSSTFLLTNVVLTWLTIQYSENVYGMGFFLSAFISLIVAIIELVIYLRNIHYHTFCGQPVIYREKKGLFTHLVNFFTPKGK